MNRLMPYTSDIDPRKMGVQLVLCDAAGQPRRQITWNLHRLLRKIGLR